jgi:WD domain, G-beta repeat
VAGGAWDGSIRVWEASTGKELVRFHEHKGPVRKLVFSHDSQWLASAGTSPGVCLRDLEAGKLRLVLGSAPDASAVDISADGKHIAAIARGKLHVWDRDGKELWSQGGDRAHTHLAFGAADSLSSLYLKPVPRFDLATSKVYLSSWGLESGKGLTTRDLGQLESAGSPILGPGGLIVRRRPIRPGQRQELTYFHTGRSESTQSISPDGRMLALSGDSWAPEGDRSPKFIRIFETATGQERCRFQSIDQGQLSLAFSPDGRALASGSLDVTVLLWDLTRGQMTENPSLADSDLEKLWGVLKASDAAAAYRAHWTLVAAAKQAAPFLGRHLRPVAAPDPKLLAALIRDLADDQFETRRDAHAALRKLEDLAEPTLRAGLRASDNLEAHRRIEQLLQQIDQLSPERLVHLRAIEALEHMRTPAARELLRELAAGAPAARVTRAAGEALRRLANIPASRAP